MPKLLLITGASRGIGFETARYFQERSWEVLNLSRKPCSLAGVHNISVDLSHPDAIESCSAEMISILQNKAKVCIVHNAAILLKDSIQNMNADDCRKSLELSIISPSYINQCALPYLKKGSSILYVGSTLSNIAVANAATYIISKHAMLGMMRATTEDFAHTGVHSCCVCPGFTDTEMLRHHIGDDENVVDQLIEKTAGKRLIQPDEIASLLFYCAENPVLNGAALQANLGQLTS